MRLSSRLLRLAVVAALINPVPLLAQQGATPSPQPGAAAQSSNAPAASPLDRSPSSPAAPSAPASAPIGIAPSVAPTSVAPSGEPAIIGSGQLPRNLTPWGMFLDADFIVKAVMIGLAFASVVTWTIWLAKTIELVSAKSRARADLQTLSEVASVGEASKRLGTGGLARQLVDAALTELRMSAELRDKDGIKERVVSRFERLEAAAGRRITRGTGMLATIGATGPFVGLFGTVWGIMNSFIGISKAHTTSLAVVAPGIAEALLATALGLVAAISAVMIYNVFARQITGYRAQLGDTSAAVLRLVSRDLDRHQNTPIRKFGAAAE